MRVSVLWLLCVHLFIVVPLRSVIIHVLCVLVLRLSLYFAGMEFFRSLRKVACKYGNATMVLFFCYLSSGTVCLVDVGVASSSFVNCRLLVLKKCRFVKCFRMHSHTSGKRNVYIEITTWNVTKRSDVLYNNFPGWCCD